jgi:hypothetical protein
MSSSVRTRTSGGSWWVMFVVGFFALVLVVVDRLVFGKARSGAGRWLALHWRLSHVNHNASSLNRHKLHYSMAATLLELPPELVVNIFHYLNDDDFFATRVVSKHLERASFSTFGKRFFRKKGYMITTASLDVLQDVASHEELRPYVQHVWFNPDCYTFGPLLFPPGLFVDWDAVDAGDRYSDDPEINKRNHQAHAACMEDHHSLIHSDRTLADKLTSAFSSLPNLKTVGMRRSDQHNPWGWRTLKEAIGRDPRELGDLPWIHQSGASGPTLLYAALMQALGTSGAAIQRLYTDAIEIDLISLRTLPLDVIQRACNSLLYLEINVTKGNTSTIYQTPDETTESARSREISQYGSGLINLLYSSPYLRELGLMIFPDRKQSHLMPPEEGWLRSYPFLALLHLSTSGIQLQNLRRIKLEKFTTTPETLISLLKPSAKNLTSIKLRDIRLLNASPSPPTTRPWHDIFTFLSTSCPKLSYLLLYHLSHATGTIRFVETLPPLDRTDFWEEDLSEVVSFTSYENLAVEAGTPHSDPGTVGPEKRAAIARAREAAGERVRALREGHWYGRNTFSYEMDEMVWHTDTSGEEW